MRLLASFQTTNLPCHPTGMDVRIDVALCCSDNHSCHLSKTQARAHQQQAPLHQHQAQQLAVAAAGSAGSTAAGHCCTQLLKRTRGCAWRPPCCWLLQPAAAAGRCVVSCQAGNSLGADGRRMMPCRQPKTEPGSSQHTHSHDYIQWQQCSWLIVTALEGAPASRWQH